MSRPIPKKLRARWDALIETDGKDIGLSECRPFLENKMVNDIFYEGKFNGRECIVKCSSRAPESIRNEYEMSFRLWRFDSSSCAKPLARWSSPDGKLAFVVMQKLCGPSVADVLRGAVTDVSFERLVGDMLCIARALLATGIVWRDIIPDNIMAGEDGRFRLIDAQFAFDRNDFREDPYLLRNWKYRRVVFAFHDSMNGRGWNDVDQLISICDRLPVAVKKTKSYERLCELSKEAAFPVIFSKMDLLRMRLYLLRIRIQNLYYRHTKKKGSYRERIRRTKRILGI